MKSEVVSVRRDNMKVPANLCSTLRQYIVQYTVATSNQEIEYCLYDVRVVCCFIVFHVALQKF